MNETICALATAPGGALGIIRISGPLSLEILSVEDKDIASKLDEKRKEGAQAVLEKNKAIEEKYNK